MIVWLLVGVFVAGYAAIAFEHSIGINKAGSALATGVLCWTIYALSVSGTLPGNALLTDADVPAWFHLKHSDVVGSPNPESLSLAESHSSVAVQQAESHEGYGLAFEYLLHGQLAHALGEISGILFFLLGAMTIVELVDAFEGFRVITDRIRSTSKIRLLWLLSVLAFFMSAVLDNLAATIVMVSLTRKLISDRETRWIFAGMIVVAANAGGAWSVIGDVTTTMLWIAGKLSPVEVLLALGPPSAVCLLVPLLIVAPRLKGDVTRPVADTVAEEKYLHPWQSRLMFWLGFGCLVAVPIFKSLTHLPPYMGMLLSLSCIWFVAEVIRRDLDETTKSSTHVIEVLRKIDTSSILFFLGILLAVECLASVGILEAVARSLDELIGNLNIIALIIGFLSSAVDNVPLVAGSIRMYGFPKDHSFWHFLAYCAGTGGSCLIIGSAAGIAAMGLERIDFMWYLRKISLWAAIGYLSGAATYLWTHWLLGATTS